MLPKLISRNGGPLMLAESPDFDAAAAGGRFYGEALWEQGTIRLQSNDSENGAGILFLRLRLLREDRIQIIGTAARFCLLFLFGENARLTIRGSSMILQDRGSAVFSGTHDRYQCDFQKETPYGLALIRYPHSFLETAGLALRRGNGFLYPRSVISSREILDDLSALLFSTEPEDVDRFMRNEICRSLFVRFTDPHQPKRFQPPGLSLGDHADFYRLRSQLLQQTGRVLEYPELMAAAGIRDAGEFRKTCKRLYGLNPTQYITEARMAHALTLLRDPALSIKEIAFRSGYPSTQYFDRVFLHYFGVPPKAFRQG